MKRLLDSSSERQLGYIRYAVPLRSDGGHQKQKMFMLNHYAMDLHYHPEREISRQIVMKKFAAYGKRIGVEELSKVNNTLDFVEACKPD